ncbi:MAG: serine hydrolase [Candidatus Marinimicrobia bacterium]|nr:serine hydrolase [Candidatus Neomarinimicrobiota bacterium]
MDKIDVISRIENLFRKQVQKDTQVRNAYLLVHSDKLDIDINIAEGKTGDIQSNPEQPTHLASVGKLFTATIIGLLHDEGKLSFDDPITTYLDDELMDNLHLFGGTDYSGDITISHLLNQTSGLADVFFPLLEQMINDPGMRITTRDAVIWGKENLTPKSKPGEKHLYTDTNYFLLGLIIENITGKPFQEVLHEMIFDPLGMKHAYTNDFSEPREPSKYPTAEAIIDDVDFTKIEGIAPLDHAGSSVIAPLEEFLIFMKALVNNNILKEETLKRMLDDDTPMGFPAIGMRYGYSIWKVVTIPFVMPSKYNCWGCVGVTGAFMFYHPGTESYIIGTFNDASYKTKALRFMLSKVINNLVKIEQR